MKKRKDTLLSTMREKSKENTIIEKKKLITAINKVFE